MPRVEKSKNFVFFDLSALDLPAALAFLQELDHKTQAGSFPADLRCHWIIHPQKARPLFESANSFLATRKAAGDLFLCLNPTGLDWNLLFPEEAERELETARQQLGGGTLLFLAETSQLPLWNGLLDDTFLLPLKAGLLLKRKSQSAFIPWAHNDRPGAHWLTPGSALLANLPEKPWGLLDDLQLSGLTGSPVPQPPSPRTKLVHSKTSEIRLQSAPGVQTVFRKSEEFPGLGNREAVDFDETLGGIRKRALIANMQGFTDLAESGMRVRFNGGKLVEVSRAIDRLKLCRGTNSYLEWKGKRRTFVTNSAFSFEGEFSWGLRQSLILADDDLVEPGRMILDYFFVQESSEFFVSATVRWPRWKVPTIVQRWALLELETVSAPLFEAFTARSQWPDGRTEDVLLKRRNKQGILAGTDFTFGFGNQTLIVGFPQNQAPRPHFLPWQLKTYPHGEMRLFLNPEGGFSDTPSAEFEGIEEHFAFYLALSDGAKLPFTVTRKQAAELIPPYVKVV